MKLVKVTMSLGSSKIYVIVYSDIVETAKCYKCGYGETFKKENKNKIDRQGNYFEIISDNEQVEDVYHRFIEIVDDFPVTYSTRD